MARVQDYRHGRTMREKATEILRKRGWADSGARRARAGTMMNLAERVGRQRDKISSACC